MKSMFSRPGYALGLCGIVGGLSLARSAGAGPDSFQGPLMEQAKRVVVSAHVVKLSDGSTLREYKPDQLACPASVTKLVTAAATLSKLTPHYLFKTGFYFNGSRASGILKGDLIVVGSGDPFVVSEKMWQLAADFRVMGIREITGDIVIDNRIFDSEARDESRLEGQAKSSHAYDAPVSAFAVNFNTAAVAMAPGYKIGGPGFVGLDPYPLRTVKIDSQLRTGQPGSKDKVDVTRTGSGGELRLAIRGAVASDPHIKKLYRSVGDPLTASGEYVRAFLEGAGIKVKGRVRAGALSSGAQLLYELESFPMSFIIGGLNKFSNNFIADMLVKKLGSVVSGEPARPGSGTMANGVKVLESFLKQDVGINTPFSLFNGSGLDTGNRMTARQVTTILAWMEKRMDLFPEFLGSLPAAGWDGTLDKRFKQENGAYKGQIRAKTGTLSEPVAVVALAGYARHPKHGLIAFAILENGVEGKTQPNVGDLREQQDQIIGSLLSEN